MQNNLFKPRIIDVEMLGPGSAKVVMEPFERGFGHTGPNISTSIIRGLNRLFCMICPFQYPRLVTPIRLMAKRKKPAHRTMGY